MSKDYFEIANYATPIISIIVIWQSASLIAYMYQTYIYGKVSSLHLHAIDFPFSSTPFCRPPLFLWLQIKKDRRVSNVEVIPVNDTTLEDLKICSISCIQNIVLSKWTKMSSTHDTVSYLSFPQLPFIYGRTFYLKKVLNENTKYIFYKSSNKIYWKNIKIHNHDDISLNKYPNS